MKKDSIGAGMGPGAGGQYGRGGSKPGGAGARSTAKVTDKRSAASSSQSTVSGKSQKNCLMHFHKMFLGHSE